MYFVKISNSKFISTATFIKN
ncbi:MAG: hypothetical protein JXR68_06895 [Bacteroidales bacterium]|nr:hypothetical protein [Bacteroidales bacterium]